MLSKSLFFHFGEGIDNRLILAGKPPKLALTACMRKLLIILNAMVKHNVPWQENYAINGNS